MSSADGLRPNSAPAKALSAVRMRSKLAVLSPLGSVMDVTDAVGQQKIYEHEALGDGAGRHLYCRLTSLSRSLQIVLCINLDGTESIRCTHVI